MPNDRDIIFDVWIAIEKLVPPAEDGNASKQKDDDGESECDAQCRNASLFNHRHYKGTARFHAEKLPALSIGCYDASVGFCNGSKGGVATPS
jgi:hypothetical protein